MAHRAEAGGLNDLRPLLVISDSENVQASARVSGSLACLDPADDPQRTLHIIALNAVVGDCPQAIGPRCQH